MKYSILRSFDSGGEREGGGRRGCYSVLEGCGAVLWDYGTCVGLWCGWLDGTVLVMVIT